MEPCDKTPPLGFANCTRAKGHSGPCAHAWLIEKCDNVSKFAGFGTCGLSKGHSEPCEFMTLDTFNRNHHPQDARIFFPGEAIPFPGEVEKSPTLIHVNSDGPSSYPISWICSRCNVSNNPRNASCVSETCTRFSFGHIYYDSV